MTRQALSDHPRPALLAMPHMPRAAALGLSFRPESYEDETFLAALYRSTRESELDRTVWTEAEKQAFIAMQFDAQRRHYLAHYPDALWLIIQVGETAVGRLYLERWEAEHRIIDIALMPQARGAGFGGAILADLMEEAAGAGKALGIHVEKENPAMRLYRRLGFHTIEDKGVYDLMRWTPAQV